MAAKTDTNPKKKKKDGRKKNGRSLAKIDWKEVDEMLECHCEGVEVAACLGIHPETLYRRVEKEFKVRFSEYMHKKRAAGKKKLRVAQYKTAVEDRNHTMQIWLGKQNLDQRDVTASKLELELKNVENIQLSLQAKAKEINTTPPEQTDEILDEDINSTNTDGN